MHPRRFCRGGFYDKVVLTGTIYVDFGVKRRLAGSNKERVLQAAMELFHLKGFQATGLEEILAKSGVCKSNFYYHFKGKDELGLCVIEQKIRDMQQDYIGPTLDNPELSPRERLIGFFRKMIQFCGEHGCHRGCIFGNLTLELSDHHEEMRALLSDFFRGLEYRVKLTLEEGERTGSLNLRGMASAEAASAIVSLLQGGILLTKGHKELRPLESSLHLMIRFLEEDGSSEQPESGGTFHAGKRIPE